MDSDMMVALGQACAHGETVFAVNHYADGPCHLQHVPRGCHAGDEVVHGLFVQVPQVRQTHAVVGLQPDGGWGLAHGVNERQVALAVAGWHSRLPREQGGLTGHELVRLALERGHSALHAVEVLTDLIVRHGQCAGPNEGPADHVFLIADPAEAFVLEGAGRFWALQECLQTRAVTGVALTRQDWRRLSPGLASLAIEQGWWRDDGSKLDFAGCLDTRADVHAAARRRWGRASIALAQQEGAIDLPFARRLLDDLHESNRTLRGAEANRRRFGFAAALAKGAPAPLGWFSFAPPPFTLCFPVCPLGDVPAAFGAAQHPDSPSIPQCAQQMTGLVASRQLEQDTLITSLDQLQAIFDHEADDFSQRASGLAQAELARETSGLAQRLVEAFDKEWRRLNRRDAPARVPDIASASY